MRWWKLELHKALELADELLAVAEEVKDPAMLLVGNSARGTILFHLGELVSANEHLEKALAVFDLRQPLPEELEILQGKFVRTSCTLACPDLAIPIVPGRNRARCWRWLSGLPILSFWLRLPALWPHITWYVATAQPRRSMPKRRWRSPKRWDS